MAIDIERLACDIKSAASIILNKDASAVPGYDVKLVGKIARQAYNLTLGIQSGKITGETRTFLVEGVRHTILSFVKELRGVDVLLANRVNFAVNVVVFKTISNASGFEIKP
jgi:hypothetical protein